MLGAIAQLEGLLIKYCGHLGAPCKWPLLFSVGAIRCFRVAVTTQNDSDSKGERLLVRAPAILGMLPYPSGYTTGHAQEFSLVQL